MELLVAARTAAGLTQIQLSERLKRPQSFVSKFESGERRLDVLDFLEIVEALGYDRHSILDEVAAVGP